MSRQKLERVLELLINEETDKASDLLHDIFVEKSRKIYASMIAEDEELEDDLADDLEEDEIDEADFDMSDDEEDFNLDLDDEDFENDLADLDLEIDREEVMESDDDTEDMEDISDEEAEMDLADEMSDDDDMSDADSEVDADEAFMNVRIEDAIDELKELFAELVGDDETEDIDYDYAEEPKLEESATLTKVNVPSKTSERSMSPVAAPKHDSRLKLANKEEKSSAAPKAKEMGVQDPQSNGGRLRKV